MTTPAHDLYRKMYMIRAVELIGARWSREGRCTNPPHFSIGAEAAAVGVCSQLNHQDLLYVYHRGHAPFVAKGGRLSVLREALLGDGSQPGATGSMHLADSEAGILGGSAIIGGALPIAAGAAWACKMEGNGHRVVCWVGDTAWDCGYFWETLVASTRLDLPLLIVIDENAVATASPRLCPPIHTRSLWVNGAQLEDVQLVAGTALGLLPNVLRIATRRYCAHVGGVIERPLGDDKDPLKGFVLPDADKRAIEEHTDAFLRQTFE